MLQNRGFEHIYSTTVAKIESGERAVRIDEAAALADLFDVSVDALLGRNVERTGNLAYACGPCWNLLVSRQSRRQPSPTHCPTAFATWTSVDFTGRDELWNQAVRAGYSPR